MLLHRIFPERHLIVPAIVACGLFMENLDSTILSTALPTISRSLGEDPIRLNLAITSYLIALAVFIPISGWVADRFGTRRVFQAALVIFSLSSIGCGAAHSLLQLVIARIIQGFGGAMMVPVGRLLVLRSVPKSDMMRGMAYLTMPAMVAPLVGPLVGGFIISIASWRWLFFINLPFGILGMALSAIFIADIREKKVAPLDVWGAVLSGIALASLVFGFEIGTREALPLPVVIGMVVAGLTSGLLYLRHSRRVANPVIDLSLFRIPACSASLLGGSLFRIGMGSIPFLLPLLLQIGFGMTALHAGLITFTSSIGAFAMKATVRPILRRFGFRQALAANTVIAAIFMATNALFHANTSEFLIIGLLLLGGFSRSFQFTAVTSLGYAEVPAAKMSHATSLNSMMQQLSTSVGVGMAAIMLTATLWSRGEHQLSANSFAPTFIGMALLSLLPLWSFLRIPIETGMEVSGHRQRPSATPIAASGPAE